MVPSASMPHRIRSSLAPLPNGQARASAVSKPPLERTVIADVIPCVKQDAVFMGLVGELAEHGEQVKQGGSATGVRIDSYRFDGRERTHDFQRGRAGSWSACFRTLALLKEARIPITL